MYNLTSANNMKLYSTGIGRTSFALLFLITSAFSLTSCTREESTLVKTNVALQYDATVIEKWMALQVRLMTNTTGVANQAFSRHMAYSGIAALQALEPAQSGLNPWSRIWNGLTDLPVAESGKPYHHPSSVNAALAAMNRSFFPLASSVDKAAIDSLEGALNDDFLESISAQEISRSSAFGKAIATAVFNWAQLDGHNLANRPYSIPVGPGLWKPTPPAFAAPATPYWGENRPVVAHSLANTSLPAPASYSEHPQSAFYQMVKEVFDASQSRTTDQAAMAIFWRDVPGVTSPGHWLNIVRQVLVQTKTSLDKAALAYALTGSAINDALIACFKTKYQYNLVRPVTYIREVMGHTTWSSLIGTPAHPEYSSAHAALSTAAAEVLQNLFGNIGNFTDHTYDHLGLPSRIYRSLSAIGVEASQSRLYAGIHYRVSIEGGRLQGSRVVENIFAQQPANLANHAAKH